MPYNGLGVFSPSISYVADKNASIGPQAQRFDTNFNDVAGGLSNVICADGQSTVTADISHGNHKITNLADAAATAQDAVNVRTLQGGIKFNLCVGDIGTSTATAYNAALSPAIAAYPSYLDIIFVPNFDSSAATTLNLNGLGVREIYSVSRGPFITAGQWKAGDFLHLIYSAALGYWIWVNEFRHSDVPPTTILIAALASAPFGYTQVTSVNDKVLRMVSGTGGGQGGNWAISGLAMDGANHFHTGTTNIPGQAGDPTGSTSHSSAKDNHTHVFTTGTANSGHTHAGDGTWRPAYLDCIMIQRAV